VGKIIGWGFSISFLITAMGLSKNFSETRSMTSLGVSILCFGVVFWLSKTTYNATKKVMMATTAVLTVTGLATWFVLDDIVEDMFGLGFYYTWEITAVAVGLPVMAYVFKHDDQ
jgi:hypothetical protein